MLTRVLVPALTAFAVLTISAGQVEAQPYSERSLRGAWAAQGDGEIGGFASTSIGRQVFDGAGGCSIVLRLNFNGTVVPLTSDTPGGSCTYTVDPNGLGTQDIVTVDPGGVASNFLIDFVFVNTREFLWIASDSLGSTVAKGVTRRQDP